MISVYLDLAIGLAVAFLLLSLLVSGLNEGVVRLLAIRSKFLWAYLRDTLDGPSPDGKSWIPKRIRDVFFKLPFAEDPRPEHTPEPAPAVVSAPGVPGPSGDSGDEARGDARPDLTLNLYERLREIDHPKRGRTAISTIPPPRFAFAVMELVSAEPKGVPGLLDRLNAAGSPLYGHLSGVWKSAANDLERFRKGTEEWFDGEMQRLTLLYRRYVRWVVASIGLLVVLLFSMDALEYGKALLRDNAFRAGVSSIAGGGAEGLAALKDRCTATGASAEPYACVTETLSSPALTQIFEHSVVSIRMPPDGTEGSPAVTWNFSGWASRLITPGHWPGFLISLAALLFGAPFWWDALRRMTGMRGRFGK
ncbi:hypothetical protein [Spongiactinospora sp. TRM90649]|uniref:hypothetical protein n=1 Tax=Spongiactinospora sp. TRM90649 TaxID=3031114 RepID=UPI0023F6AD1E|nr:hypothetical protein [Spongiactinospora sp. TRM90649]MDF5755640.1 hypothetical protein [Spongiactinospora sp. TRM90649]